jgi:hypothetical protein
MHEGAAQLTLDSCNLTFTDALVLRAAKATFLSEVFRGGIEVPSGADVMITHSSISFAASVRTGVTVQSEGEVDITDTSLSFAAGVGTGLTVEEGGAATATGTTYTVTDDMTVAVRVPVGSGTFASVDSQLIDAEGISTSMWSTDVHLCPATAAATATPLFSRASNSSYSPPFIKEQRGPHNLRQRMHLYCTGSVRSRHPSRHPSVRLLLGHRCGGALHSVKL